LTRSPNRSARGRPNGKAYSEEMVAGKKSAARQVDQKFRKKRERRATKLVDADESKMPFKGNPLAKNHVEKASGTPKRVCEKVGGIKKKKKKKKKGGAKGPGMR